jgi:hypothetical protein
MDVVILNSHNFYSTITERLLKCTGVNEALQSIWQLNGEDCSKKITLQLDTAQRSPWPIYSLVESSYS